MKAVLASMFCLVWAACASAHEVRPAIADIGVADGELRLAITLNGEALVAGANLDGIANTDELDDSPAIDNLRALSPDELGAKLQAQMPEFISDLALMVDDQLLDVTSHGIVVEDVSNLELPRDTAVMLSARWPSDGSEYSLTWPVGMGALVLRQQGVEEPFTGFLNGGDSSGPISAGEDTSGGWFSGLRSLFFGSD